MKTHAAFVGAAMALLLAPSVPAQPSEFDPVSELASKLAAILVSADQKRVDVLAADAALRDAIVAGMRSRGIAVEGNAPAKVYASCGSNLREQGCNAEIVDGAAVQAVSAIRPRDAAIDAKAAVIALELHPLLVQRDPVLDIAEIRGLLLVLEPRRVTVRPRAEFSGDLPPATATALLPASHVWPRDMRGRVRVSQAGFEVLLPGTFCRGQMRPLALACADSEGAWPLGLENAGIVANRNYFLTPEGLAFYGAAVLGEGAERWLVADQQGALTFLNANRSVVRRDETADDVVRVAEPCADGIHVVVAGSAREGSQGDELRLVRVGDRALTTVARWRAGGTVTALWAEPGDRAARVVVRSPSRDRYEAFRLDIACAR